jgi:hypothetical protein
MKKIHKDPKQLIPLSEVSAVINHWFDLPPGVEIAPSTPYIWWDRSKKNQDISLPMPSPVLTLGGRHYWHQESILHWYGAWRGIVVPRGAEAGDRIDGRGRERPSEYRAR